MNDEGTALTSRGSATAEAVSLDDVSSIGEEIDSVEVRIGPQFLNLFSQHLYSSPNKAFEELISNSWDAGATAVYVQVPDDLSRLDATIWVLDNGESMDVDGFRALWSVATSAKRTNPNPRARKPIGKFGVGKLATYLLADQLTYICKAADGVIRIVTMDFRRIDNKDDKEALHIDPVPLAVRRLDETTLDWFLDKIDFGNEIKQLIASGVQAAAPDPDFVDEFGGADVTPGPPTGTWTLAVLSSLKKPGRDLQPGWIRRLLRTALPLGKTISIYFNGEALSSAKSRTELQTEWVLGPSIDTDPLMLPTGEKVKVEEKSTPYPHLIIDGLGEVSGRARLYADKISGGKSEDIEVSNGFFINVLGRVIKPEDPYFGLENLSHSAWAKFRATIRADGLDAVLSVSREGLSQSRELMIVKALVMRLFNRARSVHDAKMSASWPDAGSILTEKWGVVPFQPLHRVISDAFSARTGPPDFVDLSKVKALDAAREEWNAAARNQPGDLIRDVVVADLGTETKLVRYDVASRRVVVNRNHPFAEEHSESSEQLRVLRDVALVDLLTDAFMADIGIHEHQLLEIRDYKDRALRLVAQVRRRSAAQIATLLRSATAHPKGFERIIGDALEYLGFSVDRLGASGEPEGVATAVVTPATGDVRVAYKFTYDAKSSETGRAKTHNVGVAALARHRKDHNADYTLVVAPGFNAGALEKEARENAVTPMLASDLARLVMGTVGYGPFNLVEFRGLFSLYSPSSVTTWVNGHLAGLANKKRLSLATLIQALSEITATNPDRPDMLHCSQIADQCKRILNDKQFPTRVDVAVAINGLALMVPNVISISMSTQDVFLNASPAKIRETIIQQLNMIPDELRYGIVREKI